MRFYNKPAFLFLGACWMSCVYHDFSPKESNEVCNPQTSWQTDILPILETRCAISECHDGITRRNFTSYEEVKQYAFSIKQRTINRSMPFDGPLPQDQIDKIACWVDNGAVEN